MSITQSDIARQLGVDQKTVSIAFGAAGRIKPETRDRIHAIARELGYRHNRLAAGLRGSATRSIGVVWPFVDPWAGDAVCGLDILRRAQAHGLATYQAQSSEDIDAICRDLDDLLARRVDAIVLNVIPSVLRHPEMQRRLDATKAVIAVTWEAIEDFQGDLIVHDRYNAIRQVADHLAKSGRKRPAMMLSMRHESSPPKFAVFQKRCREKGLAAPILIDLPGYNTPAETGPLHRDAIRRHFPAGKKLPVDSIFCFNDVGALYVMRELQDRGITVPDDVAVVGFNNIDTGPIFQPPLATGDRQLGEVADAVQKMLESRLADPGLAPRQQAVHMQFVWRESAGT